MNAELSEIIEKVCASHPDAKEQRRRIQLKLERNTKLLKECLPDLIDVAIASYVYAHRHVENRDIRRGEYLPQSVNGTPVIPNECGRDQRSLLAARPAFVRRVLEFNTLLGKRLGDVLGKELPVLREAYHRQAVGSFQMESLIGSLMPLVEAEKPTRECVTEGRAAELLTEIEHGANGHANHADSHSLAVAPSKNGNGKGGHAASEVQTGHAASRSRVEVRRAS